MKGKELFFCEWWKHNKIFVHLHNFFYSDIVHENKICKIKVKQSDHLNLMDGCRSQFVEIYILIREIDRE